MNAYSSVYHSLVILAFIACRKEKSGTKLRQVIGYTPQSLIWLVYSSKDRAVVATV